MIMKNIAKSSARYLRIETSSITYKWEKKQVKCYVLIFPSNIFSSMHETNICNIRMDLNLND